MEKSIRDQIDLIVSTPTSLKSISEISNIEYQRLYYFIKTNQPEGFLTSEEQMKLKAYLEQHILIKRNVSVADRA